MKVASWLQIKIVTMYLWLKTTFGLYQFGNSVNNFRTISTIKIHAFFNDLEELLLLIDKTKSKVKFFLLNNDKRFSMDKRQVNINEIIKFETSNFFSYRICVLDTNENYYNRLLFSSIFVRK